MHIRKLSPHFVELFLTYDALFVIAWSLYLAYLHPHSSWDFIGMMGGTVLMGINHLSENEAGEWKAWWWTCFIGLLLIAIEMALASLGIIPDSLGLIS